MSYMKCLLILHIIRYEYKCPNISFLSIPPQFAFWICFFNFTLPILVIFTFYTVMIIRSSMWCFQDYSKSQNISKRYLHYLHCISSVIFRSKPCDLITLPFLNSPAFLFSWFLIFQCLQCPVKSMGPPLASDSLIPQDTWTLFSCGLLRCSYPSDSLRGLQVSESCCFGQYLSLPGLFFHFSNYILLSEKLHGCNIF